MYLKLVLHLTSSTDLLGSFVMSSTVSVPATAATAQERPHVIPTGFQHPLDPLTADEVTLSS